MSDNNCDCCSIRTCCECGQRLEISTLMARELQAMVAIACEDAGNPNEMAGIQDLLAAWEAAGGGYGE